MSCVRHLAVWMENVDRPVEGNNRFFGTQIVTGIRTAAYPTGGNPIDVLRHRWPN